MLTNSMYLIPQNYTHKTGISRIIHIILNIKFWFFIDSFIWFTCTSPSSGACRVASVRRECVKNTWYHTTRAGDWAPQAGGWYIWKSTLTKCENVAHQSVKTTSEGQLCRHGTVKRRCLKQQNLQPLKSPRLKQIPTLQPMKDPMAKQLEMPRSKLQPTGSPLFCIFNWQYIKLIFLKSISLLRMIIGEWSPRLYLELFHLYFLLRREGEWKSSVGIWQGHPRPTHTTAHEDFKTNRPYSVSDWDNCSELDFTKISMQLWNKASHF